jgi:hypothetical protein
MSWKLEFSITFRPGVIICVGVSSRGAVLVGILETGVGFATGETFLNI